MSTKQKSKEVDGSGTDTATETGPAVEQTRARDLRGSGFILWKAGEKLDDPDPARVAKWIVRLQEEGEI